ncbi:MAG TPA: peptidoglycan DD-metalloendopeptidase family protein [Oleiagrimonas sp.]|nr:peptidoglycan DD-metalloendopeptidase family protein [Oleiagrimonas sp.]
MGEEHQGAHGARREAIRRKVQRRHVGFYRHCSHWSFADCNTAQPLHWRREHWILVATVALMTLLSAVAIPGWAHAMKRTATTPPQINLPLTLPALPPTTKSTPDPLWRNVTVKSGQTLSNIFQSEGLSLADMHMALDATKDSHVLTDIYPGDTFGFLLDAKGHLKAMRFEPDIAHQVTLHFEDGKTTRSVRTWTLQNRRYMAHGVINSSLFSAGHKAGLNRETMSQLAHVFQSEINFSRQVRAGDQFTVIYDLVYRNGVYMQAGPIVAAEFINGGKRYTAFRFTLPNGQPGYFTEDGRPLRTSLLRTPVSYSRISSSFGWRMDPVLHSRHLHAGVDLAAPKGTPIHAAGNGVITVRGWVRGYGRYIRIRDTSTISTAYAHMSRYAPGLHVGSRVHQGQVIGYVGETGWATGPHLHYEVRVHGKPVNPLTMTLPKPAPLKPALLASFKQHTRPLLARLQRLNDNMQLARAEQAGGSTVHAD